MTCNYAKWSEEILSLLINIFLVLIVASIATLMICMFSLYHGYKCTYSYYHKEIRLSYEQFVKFYFIEPETYSISIDKLDCSLVILYHGDFMIIPCSFVDFLKFYKFVKCESKLIKHRREEEKNNKNMQQYIELVRHGIRLNEAEINAKIEQLQRELDEHKYVLEL